MAKKKTGVRLGLKNLGIGSDEPSGLEDIFGITPSDAPSKKPKRAKKAVQSSDSGRPTFGEINILAARPDAEQPRSLLPNHAYGALDEGADPVAVLNDWLASRSSAPPSQQEEMAEIITLAETIQEAGLQQPIGIREVESFVKGVDFAVVFGERRWWAHVYLLSADNSALGQDVGKIKAGIVQPENLQLVQLIENLHRRNLSPIDIGYALIKSEQELKARGVKNIGKKLEKATGIGREHRSRYRHLAELDPSVQQKIRDYNLTENAVRPIGDKLRNESAKLQNQAINKLIEWRENDQPSGSKRLRDYIDEQILGKAIVSPAHSPVRGGGVSTVQGPIISKAKAMQKVLDKLDSATVDQFRIYLNSELKDALSLVAVRNRLNQLLGDVTAGKVYAIETAAGYIELATDQNVAPGILAYESYLEAAAEAGNDGEVQEFELDGALELARSRGLTLYVAAVDGEIRPV